MYANLLVRVTRPDGSRAEHLAHQVEHREDETIVHLDGNRDGNYAEPVGSISYDRAHYVVILASW